MTRTKQLTGEQLWELYRLALAEEAECEAGPFDELDKLDRNAWDKLATRLALKG